MSMGMRNDTGAWAGHRRRGVACSLVWLGAALAGSGLAGCAASSGKMEMGERAERQGRYETAYEYYCAEARERPSAGDVHAAIARVAPRAAQHYERQAARAADAGDYAEAWKGYMHALAIAPDNEAIASLIKLLEEQHADAIAPAKAAWAKQGDGTLAVADTEAPGTDSAARGRSPAAEGPATVGTPPARNTRESATGDKAAKDRSKRTTKPPPAKKPPAAVTDVPAAPVPPPPRQEARVVPRSPEAPVAEPSPPPFATDPATAVPESERTAIESGYLTTVILSKKDDRFADKGPMVDDLNVRLKDTSSKGNTDFDVYLGTSRMAKARDVRVGEAVRVRGRSGKWYDVFVLSIVDRTESVRLGIRPRSGSRD